MEFLGRKRCPVNTILSYPASGHDNHVSGHNLLRMRRLPQNNGGHDPACSTVDQGFPEKSLIKYNAPVNRGDTAFIPTVFNAFPHPFIDASRMENPFRERFIIGGWCKAEDVCIEDQFGSHSCAKWVSVNPDNSREGAAVWIEGRRRIVGFHFEN